MQYFSSNSELSIVYATISNVNICRNTSTSFAQTIYEDLFITTLSPWISPIRDRHRHGILKYPHLRRTILYVNLLRKRVSFLRLRSPPFQYKMNIKFTDYWLPITSACIGQWTLPLWLSAVYAMLHWGQSNQLISNQLFWFWCEYW